MVTTIDSLGDFFSTIFIFQFNMLLNYILTVNKP